MGNLNDLLDVIDRWALTQPWLQNVWIFGSRVRGDNRPDSDLDVLVEADAHFDGRRWAEEFSDWQPRSCEHLKYLGRTHGIEVHVTWLHDAVAWQSIQSGVERSELNRGKLRFCASAIARQPDRAVEIP
jgi:predicted nucleotidyltransferase